MVLLLDLAYISIYKFWKCKRNSKYQMKLFSNLCTINYVLY